MNDEISKRNKARKQRMLENLKKARENYKSKPKGQPCPIKGCDGRLRVTSSTMNNRYQSGYGGFVYLPGECRIKTKRCNKCDEKFRTVEILTKRFEKDSILIRKLKLALKEYIEG